MRPTHIEQHGVGQSVARGAQPGWRTSPRRPRAGPAGFQFGTDDVEGDPGYFGTLERSDGGRARFIVEQGHLAEMSPGSMSATSDSRPSGERLAMATRPVRTT